jgi:hypothetical protein
MNIDHETQHLMDDVYDYLFENEANIGTNILDEFPDSYVDYGKAEIHLLGSKKLGEYVLTMRKVEQ